MTSGEIEKITKAAALSYQKGMSAPVLAAYGENHLARQIVQTALEQGITIKQESAVELFAVLKKMQVNSEIPAEIFEIVARIYTFIHLKGKKLL